jgi:hypothetical protein
MEHYVGIDVSLEFSSVCAVDAAGTLDDPARRQHDEAVPAAAAHDLQRP